MNHSEESQLVLNLLLLWINNHFVLQLLSCHWAAYFFCFYQGRLIKEGIFVN